MSLESSNWISREQHKSNNEPKQLFVNEGHQQPRGVLKIPIKQFILPAESTNRFTQTEQPSGYRGNNSCVDDPKEVMFDPNISQQQQQSQSQQTPHQSQEQQPQPQHSTQQLYSLEKKDAEKTTITEFPFCYNVNVLQKVQQQQSGAIGGINGDEKSCYRFDVSQPFTYNYALVNQMSLAAAASTATFKCDVCGLVFAHLSLLNHHKRLHNTSEHSYTCDICGSSFSQASELKTHKQNNHSSSSSKSKCCTTCGVEVDCTHVLKKKAKFLRCENCEDGSERDSGFEGNHEPGGESEEPPPKGHHPVKRRGMATVTKCHKCNGSGIIFVGGIQGNVEKPFHCNICDGTFSRYSSLWSHKRLHSGDKPFKCEFCGISFARAAYLKNHGRVHSGERPFKCSVCGMQFSQSPHLKNHERIHSGERPYECEICNKAFARHSTLWNHRRIHTGEKPYRCNVCGSAFNQATHLKNHAKVHTGEKPHRCDICDVGFSDRFALKRHRGIHEKYGQTGPSQQQQSSQQPSIGDLYKCDVNDVIKQTQQNAQTTQSRMDDIYKCDVTGGIAFPGCSRPPDPK